LEKLEINKMADQKLENFVASLRDILKDNDVSTGADRLVFKDDLNGKGLLWTGSGASKQIVFYTKPDRFFLSESVDLAKEKSISINKNKVLDETELGPTVVKSNLRQVGKLKGLIVDGSVNINQSLFYEGTSDRLGLGTAEPKYKLTILDDGTELILGAKEHNQAAIGTFNSTDIDIVTDNTTRISVKANGNIELGNRNFGPVNVGIHGILGINVNSPDSRAHLHISGPLKFNDTLHLKGSEPPQSGAFNQGDIVWNSSPESKKHVGWVCVKAGNPGVWSSFGEIK